MSAARAAASGSRIQRDLHQLLHAVAGIDELHRLQGRPGGRQTHGRIEMQQAGQFGRRDGSRFLRPLFTRVQEQGLRSRRL